MRGMSTVISQVWYDTERVLSAHSTPLRMVHRLYDAKNLGKPNVMW